MKKWHFYRSKFNYKQDFFDPETLWSGHQAFVYDLIAYLKPKNIVELGTHKGCSLMAMAQAVLDQNLTSKITAIDTWQGDKHAGFYGQEILTELKSLLVKYYAKVKIKLLKKTFDQALANFPEHSIDLLHIDGLHTYQAVKHDFFSWLPKLKKTGVILLHDTVVRQADFGVWKFFVELKKTYPHNFNFTHSAGLGVIALNNNLPSICQEKAFRQYYSTRADLNYLQAYYQRSIKFIPWQIASWKNNYKSRLLLNRSMVSRTLIKIWNFLAKLSF